ncbi:MAG: glycoside hydrolase family 97 C-terminal domain-containing protein [Verrucomicrobiota bacterium]
MWDETRLLEGDPGKAFVVARRSGENWYVAAINQDVPSRLTIPTSFLGKGNWMVHAFADGAEAAVQPTQIDESKKPLSSDALSIHLAPDGGYVATLTPAP